MIIALLAALCLAAPPTTGSVAVLPFAEGDGTPGGLGHALAAMVVEDLLAQPGWVVVERSRLSEVVAEIDLGKTRLIDPKTAAPVGKVLGAEHLVMGSWAMVSNDLVLEATLVETGTGKVLSTGVAKGPQDQFALVEQTLFNRLVGEGKAPVDPSGLGAARSWGAGLQAEARGDLAAAREAWTRVLTSDPGFGPVVDGLTWIDGVLGRRKQARTVALEKAQAEAVAKVLQACPFGGTPGDDAGWVCLSARWLALEAEGSHCQKAEEMWAVGRPLGFALPHPKGFAASVEALLKPYGGAAGLGLKRDRWTLGWDGPYEVLLGDFPVFHDGHWDGLVQALGRCGPPDVALKEVERIAGIVRRQGVATASRDVRSNPVPLPAAIEAWSIRYEAREQGFSEELGRRADALLAPFPVGDKAGRELENVVETARSQGEMTLRHLRSRLGLDEAGAVALVEAFLARPEVKKPGCGPLVAAARTRAQEMLSDYAKAQKSPHESDLGRALDRTAMVVGPVLDFGCWAGHVGATPTWDAVAARIKARPAVISEGCAEAFASLDGLNIEGFDAQVQSQPEMAGVYATSALLQWYGAAADGCVGPIPDGKTIPR